MKIEEIIEMLEDYRDYLHNEFPPQSREKYNRNMRTMCDASVAIAALERLKPTTITDDPATWPPMDTWVLIWLSKGPGLMQRKYEHMRGDIGNTWQYLPEWEG